MAREPATRDEQGNTAGPDEPAVHDRTSFWSSVGFRLALFVSVLSLCGAGALGLFGYRVARDMLRSQIDDRLAIVATNRRDRVNNYIAQQRERMALLTSRTRLRALLAEDRAATISRERFREETRHILVDAQRSTTNFVSIAIASPEGEIVTGTDPSALGRRVAGDLAFLAGREDTHFGMPVRTGDGYRADLTAPMLDENGDLLGVAWVILDVTPMYLIVSEVPSLGSSGEILLVARSDGELHFVFPTRTATSREHPPAAATLAARETDPEAGVVTTTDYRGQEVLAAFRMIEARGWRLVVKMDTDEAYAPVTRLAGSFLFVAGLLAIVGLVVAYLASRRFTRPLRRITDAALAIARGEPHEPIDHRSRDEIGALAAALDWTSERLHSHREELEARVAQRTAELRATNAQLGVEIRDRETLEIELRQAKELAESANEAKSMFLAMMSHEIRTPMNGILGMADLLASTTLTSVQREYLSLVQESAESLLAVINEILDFSRLEAERFELDARPFALRDRVGNAMKALAIRAHEKGLELASRIAPDVPDAVVGDAMRLRQVLVNLVGNAIKFTDEGEVGLDVTVVQGKDDSVVLHFQVWDTGPGIPIERQEAIFQAFELGDPSFARTFGGAGLGLTISARLIQLMDGEIWLDSDAAEGSVFHFTVTLPLADPSAIEVRRPRAGIEGLRVLIVDDNATNCRILTEVLTSWKMRPTALQRPGEALDELQRAHREGDPYHLMLVDAVMPEMDGFTLAERVLGEPEPEAPVVLMLSSSQRQSAIARCREIGIADYLLKPVSHSDLLEAIERVCVVGRDGEPTGEQVEPRPFARSLDVLLAEDSNVAKMLVTTLLDRWGHDVTSVDNGREAVEAFEQRPFDLVLMDVQMPELDGLDATRAIRRLERDMDTHVPIIAMTAHAMKGDRERCLAAGMDGYVAKPVRAEALRHAIERYALRTRDEESGSRGAVDRGEEALPAIDWETAIAIAGGNRELVEEIVDEFVHDCPRRLAEIETSLERGDLAVLRRAAHTLKGEAQALAARALAVASEELERASHDGDLAEAAARWPAVRACAERLLAQLGERSRPPAGGAREHRDHASRRPR